MQRTSSAQPQSLLSRVRQSLFGNGSPRIDEVVDPSAAWRRPRSRKLRIASGVCYAVSRGLGINLRLLRLLTIAGLLFAPPLTVVLYLGLTVLLRAEPLRPPDSNRRLEAATRHQLQEPLPTVLVAGDGASAGPNVGQRS